MSRHQFTSPIFLTFHDELEQISSIGDAIDFLRRWPLARRGPIYRTAFNACQAVKTGQLSIDDAKRAFLGFAKIAKLVDDDDKMVGIGVFRKITIVQP